MIVKRLAALWASITEPRHLKVVFFTGYCVTILTGLFTLLVPPMSIAGLLGPALTVAWSAFLLMGGFGGALTVFPGWWWAERLSIVLVWTGIGIYGLNIVVLHLTGPGSRLTQLGVLALAALFFLVEWLLIRKYSFEPRPHERR